MLSELEKMLIKKKRKEKEKHNLQSQPIRLSLAHGDVAMPTIIASQRFSGMCRIKG